MTRNDVNAFQVFEDHHHDLLLPPPILPPPTPQPQTRAEEIHPSPADESIIRLSLDLQQASPPAYNPDFFMSSPTPAAAAVTVTSTQHHQQEEEEEEEEEDNDDDDFDETDKRFPPTPTTQDTHNDDNDKDRIPFVTASVFVDCGENIGPTTRTYRANTFASMCDPIHVAYPCSLGQDYGFPPPPPPPQQQQPEQYDNFVVTPSRIEPVIIDEPPPERNHPGYAASTRQCQSCTCRSSNSSFFSSSSSPLSQQARIMLWKTGRLSCAACRKAAKLTQEMVIKPSHQVARRSMAHLAKEASSKAVVIREQVYPQAKVTAQTVGRQIQQSSVAVCRSVRDWDAKHQVSQQVIQQTKQGIYIGTKSIQRHVLAKTKKTKRSSDIRW